MIDGSKKPGIDWELVERDYRAGLKTLRQIGSERGVSHVAIQKRAKTYGWTRDLSERIQARARYKVTKSAATRARYHESLQTKAARMSDTQVVEQYSDIVAAVDEIQREDVRKAIDNTRAQLQELATLGDSQFRSRLEWLGQVMDESGPTESGGFKADKVNELYRYVISLAGRIKMSKEIAAAYAVYIPIQRKIFGLDGERRNTSGYEDLLRRIGEQIA
jgi:hypothetical protein